jgi:hypothetical protein
MAMGVAEATPSRPLGVASTTPMTQLGWPATRFFNFNILFYIFFVKNK